MGDEHARMQARHMDDAKPSHGAVKDAQKSWGNVFRQLRSNTGPSSRSNMEQQTLNYYQNAAWTLSTDTPLVQGSPVYSKSAWHRKKCDHEALRLRQKKVG